MHNYVQFTKVNGNLEISLLSEGRTFIEEGIAEDKNVHSDSFFLDLIEHQLCNGWQTVNPEDVGALTEAIILSDLTESNETLYSNIDSYQLKSPVDILLADGKMIFQRAE